MAAKAKTITTVEFEEKDIKDLLIERARVIAKEDAECGLGQATVTLSASREGDQGVITAVVSFQKGG